MEKKGDIIITLMIIAIVISGIGMLYSIYINKTTDFLIFGLYLISSCFFLILYSKINRLEEKIDKNLK